MLGQNAGIWGSSTHTTVEAGMLERGSLWVPGWPCICKESFHTPATDSRHSSQEAKHVL